MTGADLDPGTVPAPTRRIVAMGGADDETGSVGDFMRAFLLSLVRGPRRRVCLIPTASADDRGTVAAFYERFAGHAEASWLPLFQRRETDLREHILEQDLVLVWGGNTANMLAIWRTHGIDSIVREAWQAGVVLAGVSAGAICWFEASVTDSFGPTLAPLDDGLRLLPGSCCPHFDNEPQRRPTYRRLVASGFPAGYGVDDAAALIFEGTELVDVVASTPDARAYRVELGPEGVSETPLPTRYLGA